MREDERKKEAQDGWAGWWLLLLPWSVSSLTPCPHRVLIVERHPRVVVVVDVAVFPSRVSAPPPVSHLTPTAAGANVGSLSREGRCEEEWECRVRLEWIVVGSLFVVSSSMTDLSAEGEREEMMMHRGGRRRRKGRKEVEEE